MNYDALVVVLEIAGILAGLMLMALFVVMTTISSDKSERILMSMAAAFFAFVTLMMIFGAM